MHREFTTSLVSVRLSRRVLLVAPALLLLSCGSRRDTPPAESLTLKQIQQHASEKLSQTPSMRFALDVEGDSFIDTGGQIRLKAAKGDLARPDKVACEFQVSVFRATNVSVRMISIGDQSWTTDLLTGNWTTAPPELGYNPSLLYDNQRGLGPVMGRIEHPELVGSENIDGDDCYHIKGVAGQASIDPLTSGTLIGETVGPEVWVSTTSMNLIQVKLEEPENPDKDEPAVWTLQLSRHNEQVSVEPPI